MALTGKRKAAMLLMTLDSETAKQLLMDQPSDIVQEIAIEMARLDASGNRGGSEFLSIAEDFCTDLSRQSQGGLHVRAFLTDMMSVIEANSERGSGSEIDVLNQKDPFFAIGASSPEIIAKAIMYERPQVIALVLSALPAQIATDVMSFLDHDICCQTACKMALPGEIAPKTKKRIGEMVLRRITELNSQGDQSENDLEPTEHLRKVAMVLSGLEQEIRDQLIEEVSRKDPEVASTIKALMVTWEDIPRIYDRSLQEALRSIEPGTLAKALFGADSVIIEKIRASISERAAESLDEELSLMQDPLKKEVLAAREEVINPLRTANETGELRFIEG